MAETPNSVPVSSSARFPDTLQISKKLHFPKNTRVANVVSMFTKILRFFNSYFVKAYQRLSTVG
ncbi:hypothetical protein COO91_00288 [Nostoc flagelliforme CCNUN1]|uniref:Uncharacterized protein n=1 Tax=Nostoc flagelliforme CCNUN1 TaxID=2038116 RepID=A0A2K8SHY2_9NOSO|nr:hypothetical protein COO91_00288 [Nostoc flagelliforme CCNUN1]